LLFLIYKYMYMYICVLFTLHSVCVTLDMADVTGPTSYSGSLSFGTLHLYCETHYLLSASNSVC
jgi:hypothetical protein